MANQHKSPGSGSETWLKERLGNQGSPEALVRFEFAVTEGKELRYAMRVLERPSTQVEDDGAEGSRSVDESSKGETLCT
jgi:hypothetical protein